MNDCINIIGVKVGDKYYITQYRKEDAARGYNAYSSLLKFKIDGENPKPSFHPNWCIVDSIPKVVERLLPRKDINIRYELINKDLQNDKIPLVIRQEEIPKDDEGYTCWEKSIYGNLESLYQYKWDIQEETYEQVEFTYETILTLKNINSPKTVVYTKNIQYSQLAHILLPSIVLPNTECKLTAEESYRIIREHVKQNINPQYAAITYDYDFCFTVEKVIKLVERESYKVDVNVFRKRAKPKYETRYRYDKRIKCFEIAPKPYNSYPVVEPFSASNQKELEEKIQTYLDDLMEKINEPIKYCKCCKGTGVVIDED